MDDFTGPRERSDLGFITFDLSADILPDKLAFSVFSHTHTGIKKVVIKVESHRSIIGHSS